LSDHRTRARIRTRRRRSQPRRRENPAAKLFARPTDAPAWAALAIAVATLCWYLAYLAAGDGSGLLGYLNAAGIWLGLFALAAALLLIRKKIFWGAAIGLVVALATIHQGWAFSFGSPGTAPGFRLVTASLRGLNPDMASAATTLLAAKPDVLVVQEAHVGDLLNQLNRAGGTWNHAEHEMQIIACRCRILNSQTAGGILSADVALPGGPVRIWNIRAPKAYDSEVVNQTYFTALASQMSAQSVGIAAGDFNATPWNTGYAMTASVARDGWREGGRGPGFTFPTRYRQMGLLMPFIQIDHVFLTGPLRAARMRVIGASNGADHYPVAADIVRRS